MIKELNTFSPGSYVSAEDWNGNFNVINKVNSSHAEAIEDAYSELAFPNSNLSNVFARVKITPNSHYIDDYYVDVAPEQEYYRTLPDGQDLTINIKSGLNSQARILIQTQNARYTKPFLISYSGTVYENKFVNTNYYRAGFYYVFIYETNGLAQIKLIWAGA